MYSIPVTDFNLDYTLGCGQVFRWNKLDNAWKGIIGRHVVHIAQEGDCLIVDSTVGKSVIIEYFRLEDDLSSIYASIGRDEFIEALINKYRGLRLIKQDPWECLVSYMCSCNNTICNISSIIERIAARYGERIDADNYAFPTFEELKGVSEAELRECKIGFRAKNLHTLLRLVEGGDFELDAVGAMSYPAARLELQKLRGVGPKIADCVMLFAYGVLESFPVDTHIERIMREHYSITGRGCGSIVAFARDYFGEYCGYAQEYLYMSRMG